MLPPAPVGRATAGRNLRRMIGRSLLVGAAIIVLVDCSGTDVPESSGQADVSDLTVTSEEETAATTTTDREEQAGNGGDEADSTEEAVVAFADAVGAGLVVAEAGPDRILVWHDGSLTEQRITGMERVWSDGSFIYRQAGEGGDTLVATASTPDGTVICDTDGPIHHVTERADGSYVAAVEEQEKVIEYNPSGETPVPLYAVDCQSGERTPIAPMTFYGSEVGGRTIERIKGREFTMLYDVEGNADVVNETGVTLNGEDYSGYATISPDAAIVVYGDMGAGAGPHYSSVLVARDTVAGDLLWSVDLGTVFKTFDIVDTRVVVQLPDDATAMMSGDPTGTTAVVLDIASGDRLDEVDLSFNTLFIG